MGLEFPHLFCQLTQRMLVDVEEADGIAGLELRLEVLGHLVALRKQPIS